jgi:hypothetical protein
MVHNILVAVDGPTNADRPHSPACGAQCATFVSSAAASVLAPWTPVSRDRACVGSRRVAPSPRPITGRCLCGGVTYSVDAEPVWQGACYCTNCQRQTATAFSVIVGVPSKALTVEGSALASFKTASEDYQSTTEPRFCSACGSPIFSTIESMPGVAFLKAGTIDDASWIEPTVEIWTRSAQPWAPHFENAMRFDRTPPN